MSTSSRLGERELRCIRAAPPCPALAATTLQHSSLEFSLSPAACRKRCLSLSLLICNLNGLILWPLLPTIMFYVVVLNMHQRNFKLRANHTRMRTACARSLAIVSSTIAFVGGNLLVFSLSLSLLCCQIFLVCSLCLSAVRYSLSLSLCCQIFLLSLSLCCQIFLLSLSLCLSAVRYS